jgi:hypothetical protein
VAVAAITASLLPVIPGCWFFQPVFTDILLSVKTLLILTPSIRQDVQSVFCGDRFAKIFCVSNMTTLCPSRNTSRFVLSFTAAQASTFPQNSKQKADGGL